MTDPVSLSRALCSQIVKSCEKAHGRDLGKKVEDIAKQTFGGGKHHINVGRLDITPEVFKEYTPKQLLTLTKAFEAAGRADLAQQCFDQLPKFNSDSATVSGSTDEEELSVSGSLEGIPRGPIPEDTLCKSILALARQVLNKRIRDDRELRRDAATEARVIFKANIRLDQLNIDRAVLEQYHGKDLSDLALIFRRLDRDDLAEQCDAIIEKRGQAQYQLCEYIRKSNYNTTYDDFDAEIRKIFSEVGMNNVTFDDVIIDDAILDGYGVKELSAIANGFRVLGRFDLSGKCDSIAQEREARCQHRLCDAIIHFSKEEKDDERFQQEIATQGKRIFSEIGRKSFNIRDVVIDRGVLFDQYNPGELANLAGGFERLGRTDLAERCKAARAVPSAPSKQPESSEITEPVDPFTKLYYEYDIDQQEIMEGYVLDEIEKLEERELYELVPFNKDRQFIEVLDLTYNCDEILHSKKALVKDRDLTPTQKESIKEYAMTHFKCSEEELVFNKFSVTANGKTLFYQDILEKKQLLIRRESLTSDQIDVVERSVDMWQGADWNMYNVVVDGEFYSYADILRKAGEI